MGMADVCRVCLSGRRRLHPVNNTVFQETWERLTHAKFNAHDGRPLLVCYMCCAQLQRSHQLMKRALTAEELFTDIINNDHCEQSQITLIFLASQTKIFNDKYVIQNVHHLDSNQSERNTVNEIKKEDEGESISIKEEREDSRQDENLDGADVESGTSSDDDVESGASSDDYSLLKKILETEVRIVLEKIDIGAQTRKRTLNEEAPQQAKRTKLDETLTDKNPLVDTASRNLPTNNCKASSDLSLSKYLSADSNVGIYKNKEINCEQLNTPSTELNILQKHKIQVENVIVLNSQTLTSKVCYSNAENEKIGLSKSADMVAPSTSLHRIDEGNKTNSSEKKESDNKLSCHVCKFKCATKNILNIHLRKHTEEKLYMCDLCDFRSLNKSHLTNHIKYKHTNEGTLARPYKCNLCDYRCSHNSNLKSHIKFKHTNEKNFSCHMSRYKCVTKKELNTHLRKDTAEKPYICDLCDYRCSGLSNLRRHITCKHTNEGTLARPYKCNLCDYRCSHNSNLKSHIKFKHTNEKNFSCHMSRYKCVTKKELNTHLRKDTAEKPYICDLCDYRCSGLSNLRRHITCKHTNEGTLARPYKCNLCDYRCSHNSNLKSHIKFKHTNEKNFSCHMCQYKFVTKNQLNIHLRKHTGEKPYECHLCGYRCSHNSNLKSHIKFKHTNEKNFSCHMCQYKFVTKNQLNIHLRKHTGEKPYECHLCGYRCSHNSNLKSHIKFKHTNEKNFSCHMCQYKFVTKKELNIHLRKHTGEKPYICDLCDYRCSNSSNLRRHIKCKHTNEGVLARPYKCDLCDYRCSLNGNLKSHIKFKHKNEKNFSCHMCQYKFVTKNQLNIHLRKHTGEKPYKCDLCDYRSAQNGHLRRHIKAHKRRDSCKTIQM